MRRKEKEITSLEELETIIRQATICRLGLCDQARPYIVPLNFGYNAGCLYFHSAAAGKKMDLLRKNPHVCFEFDEDCGLVPATTACHWSMRYRSVIGYGTAHFLADPSEKREALGIIMQQYTEGKHDYLSDEIDKTYVFLVKITEISGKKSL